MTPVHPGLPISTPHGVGVAVCVRSDGMVVTKLAGTNSNGYIGYFHPSSIGPAPSPSPARLPTASSTPFSVPSSSSFGAGGGERHVGNGIGNGGVRSGSAPSFLPSAATVPPIGMFQPVSPLRATAAVESLPAPPPRQPQQQPQQQQGFQFQRKPPPPQQQLELQPGFQFQTQQQPQPQQQQGFQFQHQHQHQQPQQQQQQHKGFQFRRPDGPCATLPPRKRRRSDGAEFPRPPLMYSSSGAKENMS